MPFLILRTQQLTSGGFEPLQYRLRAPHRNGVLNHWTTLPTNFPNLKSTFTYKIFSFAVLVLNHTSNKLSKFQNTRRSCF